MKFRFQLRKVKERLKLIRDSRLIESSGLFEREWYLKHNSDVAKAGVDPARHYVSRGGFEGRRPGPNFDSRWYLDAYEDVRNSGWNPLVHFLKYGQKEERKPKPPLFKLSRMYDYSKQTNSIIFEESPERIFLRRPQVIGRFDGTLNEGEALCPRPYVSVIENAIIFGGESLVVVNDNLILNDELVDFAGREFGKKTSRVEPYEDAVRLTQYAKPSLYIKEGVLLSCGHDANYFHWLAECLPKLLWMDSLEQFNDVPLLIPAGLHTNLMVALKRLNTHNRELIYIETGTSCAVERLIVPSALSRIVDRYEGSPVFNVDIVLSHTWLTKVSERLKENVSYRKKPWRKIFLTRRKGIRALGNREQIELMLLEQGFEIVELEGASLDFQIELFSEASMVVAPTGAALTNMLFCRPGTKVIIFMSNHETTNFYFWSNLGAINNLDITTIAGERLFKLTDYWSVHDDYVVDADLVLEEIKKSERTPRLLNKFFLMTRGRTGSTAVIDELDKGRGFCVTQELFLTYDFDKLPDFDKLYDLLLPYNLWKERNLESSRIPNEHELASRYLEEAETLAIHRGAESFGFKLLSHHFDESPFLTRLLKSRGYQAIYLTRNIARQVISGIVANQSGVWNTRQSVQNSSQYHIDLDEFQQNIQAAHAAIEKDYARLTTEGFRFIVLSYEEFCRDRNSFYEKIFHFLGLPAELPPRSDWSVIIKDLRATIANYDEVSERAAAMGMPLNEY